VNWRQRNIGITGDILRERQHKYFMVGIVVVLEYLFKIRYFCSRLRESIFVLRDIFTSPNSNHSFPCES
jgi:hypothetical protein